MCHFTDAFFSLSDLGNKLNPDISPMTALHASTDCKLFTFCEHFIFVIFLTGFNQLNAPNNKPTICINEASGLTREAI
jgi:hypothetical protein